MNRINNRSQEILRKVREATEQRIDVDQLLIDILVKFGGTAGMAEKLDDTYEKAGEGSAIRARILSDTMGLIHRRTMSGAEADVTEEDAEAMLREMLREEEEGRGENGEGRSEEDADV